MLYQFSVKNQWNPNWLWKKSRGGWIHIVVLYLALVICNIALENGWFIDGLPIKVEVFQSYMLVYQRAPHLNSTRSVATFNHQQSTAFYFHGCPIHPTKAATHRFRTYGATGVLCQTWRRSKIWVSWALVWISIAISWYVKHVIQS